jgi:hypothetical protein
MKEIIEKVCIALSRWESMKSKAQKHMIRESETTQMNTMSVGRMRDMKKKKERFSPEFVEEDEWFVHIMKNGNYQWPAPKQDKGRVETSRDVHAHMLAGNGSSNASSIDLHHTTLTVLKKVAVFEYLQQRNRAHLWRRLHGEEMCKVQHTWDHGQKDDDTSSILNTHLHDIIDAIIYTTSHPYLWRENMAVEVLQAKARADVTSCPERIVKKVQEIAENRFFQHLPREVHDGRQSKAERANEEKLGHGGGGGGGLGEFGGGPR